MMGMCPILAAPTLHMTTLDRKPDTTSRGAACAMWRESVVNKPAMFDGHHGIMTVTEGYCGMAGKPA